MTVQKSNPNTTGSNHRTGSAGRKHCGAHSQAENHSWRLVIEHTLEEIHARVNKQVENSQPVHLEMKRQVNSDNNNADAQRSDSKHIWRRSGTHTQRKTGKRNQQLEISAPSTGWMSSVPRSALTWRMISVTARAPEK